MFWHRFTGFTDRIALVDSNGTELTYAELAAQCSQFAAHLADSRSGIVLIEADNSIESIVAFYGTLIAQRAAALVEHDNAALIGRFTETYKPAFQYSVNSGERQLRETGYGADVHPDLALLMSTSGSTGSAKAVRLSVRNLEANAASICTYLGILQSDRAALLLPMHYSYGLSVLNSHLAVGATCFVGDHSVTDDGFFDFLEASGIHSFAGVPLTFDLLERRNFRQQVFPELRYLTQAGGKLSPEIVALYAQWARDQTKQFFVMYGQTEATARISWVPPDKLQANADSIGIAVPGGELKLIDTFGSEITEPDVEGELVYRGDNIMMGYAGSVADLSRGHELSQLKTGDLAKRDSNGLYRIVGRLKRIAKIYGKRFNLDEIEAALSHGTRAVYCTSDDQSLFVTCIGEIDNDLPQLICEKFGIELCDIHVNAIDAAPTLASGKIDYGALAAASQASRADEADERTPASSIRRVYAQAFPQQSFPDSSSFVSLGGDSLSYIQVSMGIEEVLGFLPDGWEQRSIGELESLRDESGHAGSGTSLESGIALRAMATLSVVLGHVTDGLIEGGANLLLVLSGCNYYRFQLPNLLAGEFWKTIRSVLVNILIPYWLIVVGYGVLRNGQIPYADVLLVHNNLEPIVPNVPFGVWYVQALIQCIVIFSVPLAFAGVRSWVQQNPRKYAVIALALCVAVRSADQLFSFGGWGSIFETNWVLWLFALGLFLAAFNAQQNRAGVSVLSVVLAAFLLADHIDRMAIVALGCLILIWCRMIRTGRLAGWFLGLVGSASLFIYMLHIRPYAVTENVFLRVVLGIAFGIVVWQLYEFVLRKLLGRGGVLARFSRSD